MGHSLAASLRTVMREGIALPEAASGRANDGGPAGLQSLTVSASVIEDGVIRLRPLDVSDAAAHLSGCDSLIVDRLSGGTPPTLDDVNHWLLKNAAAWAGGHPVFDLGIEDSTTSALVGCVGMQRGLAYLSDGQVNLSYAIYAAHRGKGRATRAVRLAMRVASSLWPVDEFVIRVAPHNGESVRVAERLGFRLDRTEGSGSDLLRWYVASPVVRQHLT